MYTGVYQCVCEWLWMHVYLWVCVNVNACVLGMEPGWCESLYVYLWIYGCLCLFVTVIVYTFVYCQLVNMGIVCFGESIKGERQRSGFISWQCLYQGRIWEIKVNPAEREKTSKKAMRHPSIANPHCPPPPAIGRQKVQSLLIFNPVLFSILQIYRKRLKGTGRSQDQQPSAPDAETSGPQGSPRSFQCCYWEVWGRQETTVHKTVPKRGYKTARFYKDFTSNIEKGGSFQKALEQVDNVLPKLYKNRQHSFP